MFYFPHRSKNKLSSNKQTSVQCQYTFCTCILKIKPANHQQIRSKVALTVHAVSMFH